MKFIILSSLAIAAAVMLMATVTTYAMTFNWTQNPFEPQTTDQNENLTHYISFGVVGYDFPNLAHQADLIIVGKVLDKKQGKQLGESTPGVPDRLTHVPGVNNLIDVQKVIKGQFADKTINVVTEGDLSGKTIVEDTPDLKKNEKAVFFLRREPVYDNQWTLVGMDQGKFTVDGQGRVHGKLALGGDIVASLDGLDAKIKDTLSKPIPRAKNMSPGDSDIQAPPLVEEPQSQKK